MKNVLKIFKLHEDVILPEYHTKQSACFDIRAYLPESGERIKIFNSLYRTTGVVVPQYVQSQDVHSRCIVVEPGDVALIPTGLIFDIEEGYSVRLHSRSGLSLKNSVVLANGEGVIDADYVEESFVMLRNHSNKNHTIAHGDRIAQGECVPVYQMNIQETKMRPQQKTDRTGGFGSTGKD
jgi:dUTP pyrophosphatase